VEKQYKQQMEEKEMEMERERSAQTIVSPTESSSSSKRESEEPRDGMNRSAPVSRRISEQEQQDSEPTDHNSTILAKRGSEPMVGRATSPTRISQPRRLRNAASTEPPTERKTENRQGDTVRNMFQRVLGQDSTQNSKRVTH
jgi:hypothetical protein